MKQVCNQIIEKYTNVASKFWQRKIRPEKSYPNLKSTHLF